ncbi:MAG: hypothetical protein FWE60_00525, partial [Oscillospiraceae bacterium]|nr:hypothetical protein [Oscillospiraceae bacterium]
MKKKLFYIVNSIIFVLSFISFISARGILPSYMLVISIASFLYVTLYFLTGQILSYAYAPFIVGVGLIIYTHITITGWNDLLYALFGLISIGLGYLMAIVMIIYHVIHRKKEKKREKGE